MSEKQRIVALLSCEADYTSLVVYQGVWLADLIKELSRECMNPVRIFVHNKSAIDLAKIQSSTVVPKTSKYLIIMSDHAFKMEKWKLFIFQQKNSVQTLLQSLPAERNLL